MQSVRSVRQDTAALANYLLADKKDVQSVSFLNRARPHSPSLAPSTEGEAQLGEAGLGRLADTIPEAAEPSWSEETEEHDYADGHSILGKMLQQRRPHQDMRSPGLKDDRTPENVVAREETSVRDVTEDDLDDDTDEHPEMAPLLSCSWSRETRTTYGTANESVHYHDLEQQKRRKRKPWLGSWIKVDTPAKNHAHRAARAMGTLRTVDRGTLWRNVVVAPAACLPSAIVGVLLNILDALSYGALRPRRKWTSRAMLTEIRNDSVPAWKSHFRKSRIRGHLHLLRQHHYRAVDLQLWKCVQGWHGL